MIHHSKVLGSIATLSVLLGMTAGTALAQMSQAQMSQAQMSQAQISHEDMPREEMSHEEMQAPKQTREFQRIEQPVWLKGAITVGGLGLIGLELWWFLLSKPKSHKATSQGSIQEVTVTVDGGYEPSQILVQAGQPVRLNFDRKDPSSCLEKVRFPDFRIAQELPLNQVTSIEFTPDNPGRYEFTCGMNMFQGVVEVQSAEKEVEKAIAPAPQPRHHPDHTLSQHSSTMT